MQEIFSNYTATITDLKKDPMSVLGFDEPVAVLNRNQIVGYCIPTEIYDCMMNMLEDIQLAKIINNRKDQKSIKVEWDELLD